MKRCTITFTFHDGSNVAKTFDYYTLADLGLKIFAEMRTLTVLPAKFSGEFL